MGNNVIDKDAMAKVIDELTKKMSQLKPNVVNDTLNYSAIFDNQVYDLDTKLVISKDAYENLFVNGNYGDSQAIPLMNEDGKTAGIVLEAECYDEENEQDEQNVSVIMDTYNFTDEQIEKIELNKQSIINQINEFASNTGKDLSTMGHKELCNFLEEYEAGISENYEIKNEEDFEL